MATPTTFFGLQKAAAGENYDLDLTNANLDAIDFGLIKVSKASSSYNLNGINGASSRFMRIQFNNGLVASGIIIAEFGLDIDTNAIVIAAGTAAPTNLPNFIPAGYRPKTVSHSIPMMGLAPVTNAGSSAKLQWGFNTSGDLLLRSETTGTYTTVTGTDMNFFAVYEWDGIP
jgi:hypothetical protein